MRKCYALVLPLFLAITAFAGVTVSSPKNGATVGSSVNFVATGSTSCSRGVASMGIYSAPYVLAYTVNGSSLNTTLNLSPGAHQTTVVEWDNCGGSSVASVTISVSNGSGVFVTSPVQNSQVSSPVNFSASATTSCSKGVAAMGIYTAPYQKAYSAAGATLNKSLDLSSGTYNAVVEEWDNCGGATVKPVTFTVAGAGAKAAGGGKTFYNLQKSGGWSGYGELPPAYAICSNCSPAVTWSMKQGISSPSMTGSAAKFSLGGTMKYTDALWNNHLIGDLSTQGLPDTSRTYVPTLHNFTYDLYFYGDHLELAEALEFDIGQFASNKGYMFGTECRMQTKEWAIWDNVNSRWISTGVSCQPANGSWNHLIIKVQRTFNDQLLYQSITLNGKTATLNKTYAPFSTPGWSGVVVNFQLDGNSQQAPYSVYLDNFNFSYQ
jgi:hypothetical protein